MVYRQIWVDDELDNFDDDQLIDELENRNYVVLSIADSTLDMELIEELQKRGYTVYGKKYDLVWEIYQSYLLDNEKKFREEVARILNENGYRP